MPNRHRNLLLVVVIGAAVWSLGFSFAPSLASAAGMPGIADQVYSGICHQLPDRSFSWFGASWAVCHRCSAIYVSFLVVAVAALLRRQGLWPVPSAGVIALLLLPVLLDAATDLAGLREAGLWSRLITGLLTGSALGWLVLPILAEAVQQLRAPARTLSSGEQHV